MFFFFDLFIIIFPVSSARIFSFSFLFSFRLHFTLSRHDTKKKMTGKVKKKTCEHTYNFNSHNKTNDDVMIESWNEAENMRRQRQRRWKKEQKWKKKYAEAKSGSIVGGKACNEGWQIGKREPIITKLKTTKCLLLSHSSLKILRFIFLQVTLCFFSSFNSLYFFFEKKEEEKETVFIFLIDFIMNVRLSFCMATDLLVSFVNFL